MINLINLVYLSIGAILGALFRYLISNPLGPIGIVIVNIIASLILSRLGLITLSPEIKVMLLTGFCGSLSTFSTYIVDMINYWKTSNYLGLIAYFLASNLLSLIAAIYVR